MLPLIKIPDSGNPIVESTDITEDPTGIVLKTLVFPEIKKSPSGMSKSYPTKSESL